ncbi:MAG: thiamine pyrophosphate-dependent enzyme [Halioglobus sp.]|nr:thiamine pyrophosphate-dependent enzyme [Halioglobus sp.]
MGGDNLADPFMALSLMPASSSLFRDMTGIRFEHPQWIPENCTACGDCYTVCPDTALPALVSEVRAVLDTVLERVRKHGHQPTQLPRALRRLEPKLRALLDEAPPTAPVAELLDEAIAATIADSGLEGGDRETLVREFELFRAELGDFRFALSRLFYTLPEKEESGSGGLLSITVDPYRCKGCGACIEVCNDNALASVKQTPESVERLKHDWDFWLDLPNTPHKYQRLDDLEQAIGVLHTMLLDKRAYQSMSGGDGACLGCTEKTARHLFTATVESLMRPRVEQHVAHLSDLIERLEGRLQGALTNEVDADDTEAIGAILARGRDGDLTLADVAADIERLRGTRPIDIEELARVNELIADLKALRARYTGGVTGRGRSTMGILNATGCSSVWGSTFPFNPYPFPWANHLFQDSASVAMGVFEGHMAKMAAGFKAIRRAERLLAGEGPDHPDLDIFDWRDFTDEELHLCPPVVVVGGDGAMYDIGFQNLSRALMSGKPLKILVLDTQVYSNTGGQACTSGFLGQVSDMAAFGKAAQGKQEPRKEIGLIAMAHRNTYVMQGTIAHASHMIEGFIEGLMSRRPALFNLYCACQPEHGIGDDMGYRQAKLAVESRAYPLFRYNPDRGDTAQACFDLDGNPDMDAIWPEYSLSYREAGREKTLQVPMTFADFAMTEGRFRRHFRTAPPDTWHDDMVQLADYIDLAPESREGVVPYIWTIDDKQHLSRLIMDETMVASCEERRGFWVMLRALAGASPGEAPVSIDEAAVRRDVIGRIARGLLELAGEGENDSPAAESSPAADAAPDSGEPARPAGEALAPWIDSEDCTACDECIRTNSRIFAYNDRGKATIADPRGRPDYKDLVRAAAEVPGADYPPRPAPRARRAV